MPFAGTPPPSYVLDELFASLDPLRSRLGEVWPAAQLAVAPDSTKSAWLGSLTQASNMLTNASIDGELGQRLAIGDVTVTQWAATPENAADLVEYVSQQVGIASYSVQRLWREVVVPTVEDLANKVPKAGQFILDWVPLAVVGAIGLWVFSQLPRGRAVSGFSGVRRRRKVRR